MDKNCTIKVGKSLSITY